MGEVICVLQLCSTVAAMAPCWGRAGGFKDAVWINIRKLPEECSFQDNK